MSHGRKMALDIIKGDQVAMCAVTNKLMATGGLGDAGVLIQIALKEKLLPRLLGRIILVFPEYDGDSREVFEVSECRQWLVNFQKKFPYLPLVVHPQMTFKLLMLCEVPWERSPDGSQILPDENAAMGWMLDCGMMAYEFAARLAHPAPKQFAGQFLTTIGLGEIVNDELLEDYARTHASQRAGG